MVNLPVCCFIVCYAWSAFRSSIDQCGSATWRLSKMVRFCKLTRTAARLLFSCRVILYSTGTRSTCSSYICKDQELNVLNWSRSSEKNNLICAGQVSRGRPWVLAERDNVGHLFRAGSLLWVFQIRWQSVLPVPSNPTTLSKFTQ